VGWVHTNNLGVAIIIINYKPMSKVRRGGISDNMKPRVGEGGKDGVEVLNRMLVQGSTR
jgi:hypothetical protein